MPTREDDLMAEIDAIRAEAGNEPPPPAPGGNEPPATTPEVVASAEAEVPPQPAAAPPEKIRVRSLDDIIIDDDRLPPSLVGKSGAEILEERKRLKYQHDQAGFERNQLKAELDFTRAALAVLQRDAAKPPAPAPEPPPARQSVADVVKSRVDPSDVIQDPGRFATSTVETAAQFGADEAENRINPRIAALQAEVQQLRQEREAEVAQARGNGIATAYQAARPADLPEEKWYDEDHQHSVAAIVIRNKWPQDNPQSYAQAEQVLRTYYGGNAPAPTPAPVPAPPAAHAPPAATAPAQAAPPVGAGKTAPVQQPGAVKKWSTHDAAARDQIARLGEAFGRDAAWLAEVEAEVMRDPKTKGFFQ